MALYNFLGFSENPFSKFSAEEEYKFLNKIYFKPKYFQSLLSDICEGHSRFIFGERGSGKTALLLFLIELLSEKNCLTCLINDYESIGLEDRDAEITFTIIQEIVTSFSVYLSKNQDEIKNLSDEQKSILVFCIKHYFKPLTKESFDNYYNKITNIKIKNKVRLVFNTIIQKPINYFVSGAIEVVSDTICKSLNLPKIESKNFYKQYFPELQIDKIENQIDVKNIFTYAKHKKVLKDLLKLVHATSINSTTVFLDRIDEFRQLDSSIQKIIDFFKPLLLDTDLLLIPHFSLVLSFWSKTKQGFEKENIRFDKIKPRDITWHFEDILSIINNKLEYYSNSKNIALNNLFTEKQIEEIINLGYYSPRDTLMLLSYISDEQNETNCSSNYIENESIQSGILKFSKEYNYFIHFPKKENNKSDIKILINRILKVQKNTFLIREYATTHNINSRNAYLHLNDMVNYGLIIKDPESIGNTQTYEIIDPKIRYLVKNNILEI